MVVNEPKSSEMTQNSTPPAPDSDTGDKHAPEPCLSAYYSNSRVKPAAFVRALKTAKISYFHREDVSATKKRLDEWDPTLARTIGLLGKGPEPVARWVTEVTKESLTRALPGDDSDWHEAAKPLFDRVVRMSVEHLSSKNKQHRARAQNFLRLVLAWLVDERNLSPTDALLSARKVEEKTRKSNAASLNRDAARLLARATLRQLLDLSSVAALFESVITEEAKERREVFAQFAGFKHQISALETELQTKVAELEMANEDRANLTKELANVHKDLRDEKELRALGRTRQAGRFRGFLVARLKQPLSDAFDALGVDPPHVSVAHQRIEMAITAIDHEMETPNE